MVQTTCCGDSQECIVTDVSGLADPCMASCNVFYRLPDGSIWLLNKNGDGYLPVFVANDATKIDWNADPESLEGISNRPFKAIAWGLKLDDDGNLTVDSLILPTPDWNETDPTSKDYIKNKPLIPKSVNGQVFDSTGNATIDGTQITMGDGDTRTINQAIDDIPEQVQSDWNVTDASSPAFIKNKPTISGSAPTITFTGTPLQLGKGVQSLTYYDSISGETSEIAVNILESNWDDTVPVKALFLVEDTINKAMGVNTFRIVASEGSVPTQDFTVEGVLYFSTKASMTINIIKGGGGDTSNFVTLDTEQTIDSTKHWGEIITTGKGEEGQITTLNPDGSVTQIQKIAGSNEYTEITMASGMVEVQRLQADGTPLRTAIMTSGGIGLSTDRGYTNLTMNGVWLSNYARVKVVNNVMTVHISGAHPSSTIDGTTDGNIKTVAKLPQYFVDLLKEMNENIEFMWSNYGGGQLTYAGRIDVTGEVRLYIMPTSAQIVANNRFSCYVPIQLK